MADEGSNINLPGRFAVYGAVGGINWGQTPKGHCTFRKPLTNTKKCRTDRLFDFCRYAYLTFADMPT